MFWRGPSVALSNQANKSASSSSSPSASKKLESEEPPSFCHPLCPWEVRTRLLALPFRTKTSGRDSATLTYIDWKKARQESPSVEVARSCLPKRRSGLDNSHLFNLEVPIPKMLHKHLPVANAPMPFQQNDANRKNTNIFNVSCKQETALHIEASHTPLVTVTGAFLDEGGAQLRETQFSQLSWIEMSSTELKLGLNWNLVLAQGPDQMVLLVFRQAIELGQEFQKVLALGSLLRETSLGSTSKWWNWNWDGKPWKQLQAANKQC